ncbi:MAG: hypothetical protein AB1586_23345 [Pseudomonadota bacterium]|jgi:hypothetical protein
MGIDRHEWEHRNYKSGRAVKAAPALQPALEGDPLAHDGSLGEAEAAPAAAVKGKAATTAKTPAPKATKGKAPANKAPAKKAARAG